MSIFTKHSMILCSQNGLTPVVRPSLYLSSLSYSHMPCSFSSLFLPVPLFYVGITLESLTFFSKILRRGEAANKHICTYWCDWRNSKKSLRNIHCRPRVGSNTILERAGKPTKVLRIQVLCLFFNIWYSYEHTPYKHDRQFFRRRSTWQATSLSLQVYIFISLILSRSLSLTLLFSSL